MAETKEKNYQKQATYAERKTQLKKAITNHFYFEAIFLEYAIIEDRTESVLRHAGGIKLTNKRGNPLALYDKLKIMRDHEKFNIKFVRDRLALDLIDSIDQWRNDRNQLVHQLMKNTIPYEELQSVAEKGYELVKILDNKVKSVNHYLDKNYGG